MTHDQVHGAARDAEDEGDLYERGYQKGRQVGLDTGIEIGRGECHPKVPCARPMLDLDEIRAALAAAQRAPINDIPQTLTWLAALCDEIDQLEDQIGQMVLDGSMVNAVLADRRAEIAQLVAERDAALAECERLRAELEAKS